MNFYYQGKKPSSSYDTASGCLLIIGFGAIVFLITLLEDLDDLKDNFFQLILVTIMGISVLYGFFRKKGTLYTHRITCEKDHIGINKIKIPIETLKLDVYLNNTQFNRYHFWDSKGILAVYSIYEDDFLDYFKSTFPDKTNYHSIESASGSTGNYRVSSSDSTLYYDLESGGFTIVKGKRETEKIIPEFFVCDPKYKQGKPSLKRLIKKG